MDTVSRKIFGDILETPGQFLGSKIEVHVDLKNAFLGGIGNRRITFGFNLWFAFHPSFEHYLSYSFPIFFGKTIIEFFVYVPHT